MPNLKNLKKKNYTHAPQSNPSIWTLLTASSSFFMSVSSSHGFTSIRTDDFPAEYENSTKSILPQTGVKKRGDPNKILKIASLQQQKNLHSFFFEAAFTAAARSSAAFFSSSVSSPKRSTSSSSSSSAAAAWMTSSQWSMKPQI